MRSALLNFVPSAAFQGSIPGGAVPVHPPGRAVLSLPAGQGQCCPQGQMLSETTGHGDKGGTKVCASLSALGAIPCLAEPLDPTVPAGLLVP